MVRYNRIRIVGALLVALVVLNSAVTIAGSSPAAPALQAERLAEGRLVVLRHDDRGYPFHVRFPATAQVRAPTATIVVNFNPVECGTVTDWPQAAKDAFNHAVDIWELLLQSSQTIEVDACWKDLGTGGVLGMGGPTHFYESANTWYPVALANELAGSDLNGGDSEVTAYFNSGLANWYYGTDGNPGSSVDFVTVVLHELCHGLGFLGSMTVDDYDGLGYWGWPTVDGDPAVYDRFTENRSGQALLSFDSGSTDLADELTSEDIFFNGAYANAANGGTPPELYAPTPWDEGSSYSHLDEGYNGTLNALMTYSLASGESVHYPGPVALGMYRDMGWNMAAPVVTSIAPESGFYTGTVHITNLAGSSFQSGADVYLTRPGQNPIEGTSVAVTPPNTISCDLDLNGAAAGWWSVVIVNPDSRSGQLTYGFTILGGGWSVTYTYLPVVLRNHS